MANKTYTLFRKLQAWGILKDEYEWTNDKKRPGHWFFDYAAFLKYGNAMASKHCARRSRIGHHITATCSTWDDGELWRKRTLDIKHQGDGLFVVECHESRNSRKYWRADPLPCAPIRIFHAKNLSLKEVIKEVKRLSHWEEGEWNRAQFKKITNGDNPEHIVFFQDVAPIQAIRAAVKKKPRIVADLKNVEGLDEFKHLGDLSEAGVI